MTGKVTTSKHRAKSRSVAGLLLIACDLLLGAPLAHSAASKPSATPTASPQKAMPASQIAFVPITFADLPGWSEDDHLAAWKAFLASCGAILKSEDRDQKPGSANAPDALVGACRHALAVADSEQAQTRQGARRFFETYFEPQRITGGQSEGLLTGYYEPLIKGSRMPDATYGVPVYRRPPDLVNVVAESERGAKSGSFTHKRQTEHGLEPYLTRAEIEEGGLAGKGLELMYFKDPVDVFFMQIQGSGRVELPSGEKVRIAYDGKNGYPYTSIGKALIESGQMSAAEVSLKSLKQWLRADRERAKAVMRKNESYVFFRELSGQEARSPMGVNSIPLQPGRSLAVDTSYYAIGTPIYVDAPEITHATKSGTFRRLMVAHDVGSAIKGTERGDIYFGSGDDAGRLAGVTKQKGHLYALLPVEGARDRASAGTAP